MSCVGRRSAAAELPEFTMTLALRAASYSALGRPEEVKVQTEKIGQIAPALTFGLAISAHRFLRKFVPPWDWRRGKRMAAQSFAQPMDCLIKGNVSSKGERIYYVPGGQWYDRTRIDPAKGKPWFCTEEEAKAAGWRPSRR